MKVKTGSTRLKEANTEIHLDEFFEQFYVPFVCPSVVVKDIHRETCRQLEKAFYAELRNAAGKRYQFIIINMPPRIGKSMIGKALIAWAYGINPMCRIMYISYTAALAERHSKDIQDNLESSWYKELYDTRLGDMRRTTQFNTSQKGHFYSVGAGGSILGFGAGDKKPGYGFILMDDPQDPEMAKSASQSVSITDWLQATVLSRRNSDQFCPVILIQQRLNTEDLTGFIKRTYGEDLVLVISFKAMEIDASGREYSAIEETLSLDSLILKREKSALEFYSQYQQDPVPVGGNLIPINSIFMYDPKDMENIPIDMKIITTDTAFKTKTFNDFTVLQCWVKRGPKAFLTDQVRGKWESADVLRQMAFFFNKHNVGGQPVRKLLIEDVAVGAVFIQQCRLAGLPVEAIKRNNDKVIRASDVITYISNGFVGIPKEGTMGEASWNRGLIQELAEFRKDMKHAHDDQVDAFVDGISYCLGRPMSTFDSMKRRKF